MLSREGEGMCGSDFYLDIRTIVCMESNKKGKNVSCILTSLLRFFIKFILKHNI